MDRGQSFVAYAQSQELMQPGDGAFHHPPSLAQVAAMRSSAFGNLVSDAALLQCQAVCMTVVSTIGLNGLGLFQWPPALSSNWVDAIDQWQQLRHVMPVGFGQNDIDRGAFRVDEEVALATRLTAIGWIRSSFFPPCTAVPTNCRPRHGRNRAYQHHAVYPVAHGAACAIRRPFARQAPGASTSYPSRTPFPGVAFPTEFPTAKQTGCPSVPPIV